MENSLTSTPQKPNKKLHLSLDLRLVTVLLLAVIVIMLFLWKPWQESKTSNRTISITGEASLSAEPDEYVFSPSYEFSDTNKEAALVAMNKKAAELTTSLKSLCVSDSKIKNNAGSYGRGSYLPTEKTNSSSTYTLSFNVVLSNKELAQKVQDYLITTKPTGTISPYTQFSKDKSKQLESRARDEATKDARSKAEQSANNLGFKIGK
jgi:uncharacterized protein YggE